MKNRKKLIEKSIFDIKQKDQDEIYKQAESLYIVIKMGSIMKSSKGENGNISSVLPNILKLYIAFYTEVGELDYSFLTYVFKGSNNMLPTVKELKELKSEVYSSEKKGLFDEIHRLSENPLVGDFIINLLLHISAFSSAISTFQKNYMMSVQSGDYKWLELEEKQSDDPKFPNIRRQAGTFKQIDGKWYFSVGVVIDNPNKNHMLLQVLLSFMFYDSYNELVHYEDKVVNVIDVDSDFYFGCEMNFNSDKPVSYNVTIEEVKHYVESSVKLVQDEEYLYGYTAHPKDSNSYQQVLEINNYFHAKITELRVHLIYLDNEDNIIGGCSKTVELNHNKDIFTVECETFLDIYNNEIDTMESYEILDMKRS